MFRVFVGGSLLQLAGGRPDGVRDERGTDGTETVLFTRRDVDLILYVCTELMSASHYGIIWADDQNRLVPLAGLQVC